MKPCNPQMINAQTGENIEVPPYWHKLEPWQRVLWFRAHDLKPREELLCYTAIK